MASPPERPCSVLSESWATLSNYDVHSEDENHSVQTDNASLVGGSIADDVASLDDDDDDDSRDTEPSDVDKSDTDSHIFENQEHYGAEGRDIAEASNLTDTATLLSGAKPIFFSEPDEWPESEDTLELSHCLGPVDETKLWEPVRKRAEKVGAAVTATIHQTVTKEGLELDRPFRVVYIGDPDFKGCILDKLGDALIANPNAASLDGSGGSERFHVVPAAVGADSAPGYAELLPLQVQLMVDECNGAYYDTAEPSNITALFNNGGRCTSYRDGPQYKISCSSKWTPPDLAIFFVSEPEILPDRTIDQFMVRHSIPRLFISDKPVWAKGFPIYLQDRRSLHVALAARNPKTDYTSVLARSMVDLNTFERVCPEQLNRNLAALMGTRKPSAVQSKKHKGKSQEFHDVEKYPKDSSFHHVARSYSEPNPALRKATMLLVGLIVLSLGYAGVKYLAVLLLQYLGSSAVTSVQSGGVALTPTSTASFTRSSAKSLSTSTRTTPTNDLSVAACGVDNALSINNYLAEISRPMIESPNESDKFQVHVIGDCHVIIKAPSPKGWRKGPNFDVKVARAGQELSFELTRLFDGVHALRLVREDAYGLLNVTVRTKTKPAIEQVTEVDFGTPWLKIANWKRAAQAWSSQLLNDLNSAQAGLSEAYNRVAVDLQTMGNTLRDDMRTMGYTLRDEVYPARRDSLQRALKTANAAAVKSRKLYGDIRDIARKHLGPASAVLRKRAESLQRDAFGFVSRASKKVYRHVKKTHESTKRLDFSHIRDRVRQIGRSPSLAVAQKHARELTRWRRRGQEAAHCHSSRCQNGRERTRTHHR